VGATQNDVDEVRGMRLKNIYVLNYPLESQVWCLSSRHFSFFSLIKKPETHKESAFVFYRLTDACIKILAFLLNRFFSSIHYSYNIK